MRLTEVDEFMYIELNCLDLYAIEDFDIIYCLAVLWWNCLLKAKWMKCRSVYKGEGKKVLNEGVLIGHW